VQYSRKLLDQAQNLPPEQRFHREIDVQRELYSLIKHFTNDLKHLNTMSVQRMVSIIEDDVRYKLKQAITAVRRYQDLMLEQYH